MSLEAAFDALGGFFEAVEAFFEDVVAGAEAVADELTTDEAAEAGEEDSWRSRVRDRARNAGARMRGSMLYKKLSFYSVLSSGVRDAKAFAHKIHGMEKSALTKAEHTWKSVSDKVRHGHWFSSGHGHAMNGVTQGNYDFIVRRKRKHY